MPEYVRELPIRLYSMLSDLPDRGDNVVGIPDESVLEDVSVVILRPSGDRFGVLDPTLELVPGFGTWYIATLNLDFTAEFGEWKIRWVYKTTTGDVISEYVINIVQDVITPYWCFQAIPQNDDTIPIEVKSLMDK